MGQQLFRRRLPCWRDIWRPNLSAIAAPLDIDVDLSWCSALGAAVVGAPFEGAMLLFLFSLSNVLQEYAIGRARRAIHSLMKLRPDKALTRRDGETALLPIEQLTVGDIVIVRPGESIPLDGVIVENQSEIDES